MTRTPARCDDMRIGDGHPIQIEADDRVGPAFEFPAERGQLDGRLAQRAVGEQQLSHRYSQAPAAETRAASGRISQAGVS
jgi:hypothetical protein